MTTNATLGSPDLHRRSTSLDQIHNRPMAGRTVLVTAGTAGNRKLTSVPWGATDTISHTRCRAMSNTRNPTTDPSQPLVYQIRIKGHLGRQWADWFGGLTITPLDNGDTLLTGPVVDQAALHGVLRRVRDLGLPLLSVIRLELG